MKREIVVADDTESMEYVAKLLEEGYVLDPTLTGGKPYLLETSTVWPLVFYENDGEKPKPETKALEDVCDVITVEDGQVPEKFRAGYRVHEIYAKTTRMVLRAIPVEKEAPKLE